MSGAAPNNDTGLPAVLQALAGSRPARTPVWFMRQAGRSLPEYRALRERAGLTMLEACTHSELAAEITLQPVRRHGVDAAVVFSDIMVPLRQAGVPVRIEPGLGPVMEAPVRTAQDVERLTSLTPGVGLEAVQDAVWQVVAELGNPQNPGASTGALAPDGRRLSPREIAGLEHSRGRSSWTPVIGFGGAPFTLAAYLIEGRPSRDHLAARTLMHADPGLWDQIMRWCAQVTGLFIAAQIEAGASAAQLFDSWAGSLSPTDYRERVAPYSAQALDIARQAVSASTGRRAPLIHFGTATARILPAMHAAGADVLGVDDRTGMTEAREILAAEGISCPLQGNLDPALLGAPWEVLSQAVDRCLQDGRPAPGHVLNLGHGVPPGTDPAVLTRVVAHAHHDPAWEQVALEPWDGGR